MEEGSVEGVWNSEALCAPFLVGKRYGPSAWAPSRLALLVNSRGLREGRIWLGDNDSETECSCMKECGESRIF